MTESSTLPVRALVVHSMVGDWSNVDELAQTLARSTELVKSAAVLLEERLGVKPRTLRVTLSPALIDGGLAARALDRAVEKAGLEDGVYYGLLHIESTRTSPEHVLEVLGLGNNVYASVAASSVDENTARILYEVATAGPETATRFAVTVPGFVETPYFPGGTSLSPGMGLSVSLLYPRLLMGKPSIHEAFRELSGRLRAVEEALKTVAGSLGVEYKGLDLSLSPWMEDSVARVLEEYSGRRVYELGVAPIVMEAEKLIGKTCESLKCIGFNQVMLPLAEDNLLKKYAGEGRLTLYKLVHLMYASVSGVDMVPVSLDDWTVELAKAVIGEAIVAANLKNKPLGVRIIAVSAEPGTWIDLGRFGLTPVANIDSS